jgi:hypothetical protein
MAEALIVSAPEMASFVMLAIIQTSEKCSMFFVNSKGDAGANHS